MKPSASSAFTAPQRTGHRVLALVADEPSDRFGESQSGAGKKIRKLIAGQHYFGLEARAFRAGVQRVLARVAEKPPEQRCIDLRSLGDDFCVIGAARSALLAALLGADLLKPDGSGRYQPTTLFQEYAHACVVLPLSRARARHLLNRVTDLASRMNSGWMRNPYLIEAIGVSGSYMSRRDPLQALSLWLVLHRRRVLWEERGRTGPLTEDAAVRQMGMAIKALSSFITVRVVTDRQSIARPFAIIFESPEEAIRDCDRARGPWWTWTLGSLAGARKS